MNLHKCFCIIDTQATQAYSSYNSSNFQPHTQALPLYQENPIHSQTKNNQNKDIPDNNSLPKKGKQVFLFVFFGNSLLLIQIAFLSTALSYKLHLTLGCFRIDMHV